MKNFGTIPRNFRWKSRGLFGERWKLEL